MPVKISEIVLSRKDAERKRCVTRVTNVLQLKSSHNLLPLPYTYVLGTLSLAKEVAASRGGSTRTVFIPSSRVSWRADGPQADRTSCSGTRSRTLRPPALFQVTEE